MRRAAFFSLFCSILVGIPAIAHAVTVDGPSLDWTIVTYAMSSPDFLADQQTGSNEGDIVGDADNAAFYTAFDNAGTPSLTDGTLFFRLRLGGDENPSGFSRAAFVGIDVDGNGSLDAFVGVDNSGSGDKVGIWDAGTGANTSPSTTTISSPPAFTYTETAFNYDFRDVTLAADGNTSTDLDADRIDQYLSWAVPFADLVSFVNTNLMISIDETAPFTYVAATATQDNSLNQDLNGVNGGVSSSSTWGELGAFAETIRVPEPSSALLFALGLAPFLRRRRHS